MATRADIDAALLTRCSTLHVGNPELPIAYPDVSFSPPAEGPWLEVSLLHNTAPAFSALAAGHLRQGILQIIVVARPGRGALPTSRIVDQVLAHFPKALRIGPAKVTAEPSAGTAMTEADRTMVVCSIPWTA